MMKTRKLRLALVAAMLLLSGCATSYGAKTIVPSGHDYNKAIADSLDQQLLLNLVRLRYRDTVVFMDITSVTTQHQYAAGVSAENAIPFRRVENGASVITPSAGYSETPTITYAPISGTEFATNLLSPISSETIVLLANSGWSIERLLNCCVERLGHLSNAPSASGPTPSVLPDNAEFRQLSRLLRVLQTREQIYVDQVADHDDGRPRSILYINAAPGRECEELKTLLHTKLCRAEFELAAGHMKRGDSVLQIQTRSVLGALYNLSHAVAVPDQHKDAGFVTDSAIEADSTQTWREFLNGQFQVRSAKAYPDHAFAKIRYRDHWYWIDDHDLESKTTFSLILFLLSLQSAASDGVAPLLTVNAAG